MYQNFVPPHSAEAEKAVVGTIIREPGVINTVNDILRPEHFFIDNHRKIFESILKLDAAGEPTDIFSVSEKLKYQEEGEQVDISITYLIELMESAPVGQNVAHHASVIRDYFYLRRLIDSCQTTVARALAYQGKIQGFIEDVEKEILAIFNDQDRQGGIVSAVKVLEDTIVELEERLSRDGAPTGVPSGFVDFDGMTGGFQKSDLILLAARPAMGKTALALNFAMSAAKKGAPVVIFSLEMSRNQLMMRLLSSEARVDSSRLRKGELTEDERNRLIVGAQNIATLPGQLGIDETGGISLTELRSRCRRYKREFGLGLIIIDYLQLMGSSSTKRNESREREIAELSGGLKALAKELQVPVIALAQLNRGPDARTDHRPKTSDLRESGSLEQDADMILFVYRDEYYNPNSEDSGKAEIIIAKNRHGSVDTVKLAYQPNFVSFYNLVK
jgi:replicative DNA helicase